jgi:hypothetical protein
VYLSYKTKEKLRFYSFSLFYSNTWNINHRRYVFFLIIKSDLGWIRSLLEKHGLENEEIDSEIFLLSVRLFDGFNTEKSSIIPYLEKSINWKVSSLLRKYKKSNKITKPPIKENSYTIEKEFYLKSPNFLFENRWIGKNLSFSQKNLILKILTMDFVTVRDLANECRLSKSTIATQLQDIAAVLKERL